MLRTSPPPDAVVGQGQDQAQIQALLASGNITLAVPENTQGASAVSPNGSYSVGFDVPSDSPEWPAEHHGIELGKEVQDHRSSLWTRCCM